MSVTSDTSEFTIAPGEPSPRQADAECSFCGVKFSHDTRGELWVQCQMCEMWYHTECAGCEGRLEQDLELLRSVPEICGVTSRIWGRSLSVLECIAGSISSSPLRASLKKDTVEWRRENVFQYFAMDHNTIAFVCVMLLIICIGCTITAFFRKQSTLAWKLCKFRSHVQRIWKRNKELSKELVRTKSQLSLAEQQLIEKGTGVSGILELSRLRFELEAVRNERNALLRRLQSGGGKSQGESRENDNFDFPRMDQFSDQKDILKLITSWKENAQRLIKNLTECEGAADVMKEEMQNYVQGRQNHDSLLREKNSMRRRLEILAREKHEATKKLLSVQKDLKATQKQLEEAKGKLYRSENEIETLKKEADHVSNDKHVLQRQLDISQSEVRMLHTRLENVTKENETCRRHLRALERETWRRSESSPFRLSVTTQESQNHKGTIHDLTKLIEDETSEDQKQLMNSLDGHISDFNRQRKSESSNVIPTHDTDIDDVSVSKDDYDSEITKIPEKNFVGSPCETSLNTSNVSEKLDNEPTKAGNNFVTNLSSPSGNINCKISINKSSLEPNIFLRTLKAIERYEKSMDLNLMKRKSMQCPSDVRNKSLIDKKKTDDILRSKMKNQSLMEDLYLTREIENWPRGDLISTEGQNRTIPDVQSNITHAVFNQSNGPIAEIPPGRTRENSFHRYPDRATEKESLCSLGSMCSVCSMDGCVVNQDELSSATQSLQPCPNCLLFIQRFDDREQGRFNARRLEWLGHVIRMNDERIPKKILNRKPEGRRNIGRQKLRLLDGVEDDLRTLGVRRWRQKALVGQEWTKILREAKARLQGP
ncbi:hypothetical protein ANN_07170 [Periplaneta americana]|uniref:RING-type domain-containing protein n=1 Tax=Periplaneta americana TaxID=6978 RepID=A0ABQ8TI57_PERAM|nr:hypothetical protein ANN_07170 [Periplaneta americana]